MCVLLLEPSEPRIQSADLCEERRWVVAILCVPYFEEELSQLIIHIALLGEQCVILFG